MKLADLERHLRSHGCELYQVLAAWKAASHVPRKGGGGGEEEKSGDAKPPVGPAK